MIPLAILIILLALAAAINPASASQPPGLTLMRTDFGTGAVCNNDLGEFLQVHTNGTGVFVVLGATQTSSALPSPVTADQVFSCAGIGQEWVIARLDDAGDVWLNRLQPSGTWTRPKLMDQNAFGIQLLRFQSDSFSLLISKATTREMIRFAPLASGLTNEDRVSWTPTNVNHNLQASASVGQGGLHTIHLNEGTTELTTIECVSMGQGGGGGCTSSSGSGRGLGVQSSAGNPYELTIYLTTQCSQTINLLYSFPATFVYDGSAVVKATIFNAFEDVYVVVAVADTPTITNGISFMLRLNLNNCNSASILKVFPTPALNGTSLVASIGTIAVIDDRFFWALIMQRSSVEMELHSLLSPNIAGYLVPATTAPSFSPTSSMSTLAPSMSSTPQPTTYSGGNGSQLSFFEANQTAILASLGVVVFILLLALMNASLHIWRYGDDMKKYATKGDKNPTVADSGGPVVSKDPQAQPPKKGWMASLKTAFASKSNPPVSTTNGTAFQLVNTAEAPV